MCACVLCVCGEEKNGSGHLHILCYSVCYDHSNVIAYVILHSLRTLSIVCKQNFQIEKKNQQTSKCDIFHFSYCAIIIIDRIFSVFNERKSLTSHSCIRGKWLTRRVKWTVKIVQNLKIAIKFSSDIYIDAFDILNQRLKNRHFFGWFVCLFGFLNVYARDIVHKLWKLINFQPQRNSILRYA